MADAGFTISGALPSDAEQLAAITFERNGGVYEEHLSGFRSEIEKLSGDHILLVARAGDKVAGFGRARHFSPPEDAPPNCAPEGWYLLGIIVSTPFRRKGIGAELTRARLEWIAERAGEAYYFANERNDISIALHDKFNFRELTRDFIFPKVTFTHGAGILYRASLRRTTQNAYR